MANDFIVRFVGPALDDGSMPVAELAPSLIALGELVQDAAARIPEAPPVNLEIRATSDGSFQVHLQIVASLVDDLLSIFSGNRASALANIESLVIGPGLGIIAFILRMRNRRIARQEAPPDGGMIRLFLDDGSTVEVPSQVLAMYQSVEVRNQVKQFVRPLRADGVESIDVIREQVVTVSIPKVEIEAFDPPAVTEQMIVDSTAESVVSIASVAFVEGNKWRLSEADHTFYATIADEAFLERVDNGTESFRKGDYLRCAIRRLQYRSESGIRTEYEVVRVVEHLPRSIQIPLPLTEDDSYESSNDSYPPDPDDDRPPFALGPGDD